MPSDFESHVVARLDRLEARARRLQWLGAGLAGLAAVQGAVLLYLLLPVGRWLGLPKVVEASRIVLVDDRGRVRAQLVEDQGPRLQLFTEDGQPRAVLWVNHEELAALLLMDNRAGAGRIASVYAHDDGTGVRLSDGTGERVSLESSDKQTGLRLPGQPGPAGPAP
jgi:hypothetical protein